MNKFAFVDCKIFVPAPETGTRSAYQKYGEKESFDWPIADAGVVLVMDGTHCRKASIVLGVAAPTPIRAKAAEAVLIGKIVDEATARAAQRLRCRAPHTALAERLQDRALSDSNFIAPCYSRLGRCSATQALSAKEDQHDDPHPTRADPLRLASQQVLLWGLRRFP